MSEEENTVLDTPTTEGNYMDYIPGDFKEVPSIRDAGSMDALLKQHINLETKMGNSLSFPGKDADDEQMNEFYSKVNERVDGLTRIPVGDDVEAWGQVYKKLGKPEDAEGYELPEINYGEPGQEQKLDQSEYGKAFAEEAFNLNLTANQFSGIMKYFGKRTVDGMTDANTARDATLNALKSDWGDAVPARIERIQEYILESGGQEALEGFGDIGNNPAILKVLDKAAGSIGEDESLGQTGPVGDAATRAGIEDEIATLRGNEAFFDSKHNDHERTVNRIDALYRKLEKYKIAA